jgi:branched-chain amino acid transport system ATP-binding protein
MMGINTFRMRILAFTLGCFGGGLGGALMGNLITTIDPRMFMITQTYNILMIIVVGGLGSVTGSLIGSVLITTMLEWLRFVENPMTIGPLQIPGIPGMRMVIFSLLLIFVIIFRREGIMGMREFSWDWFLPRRRKSVPDNAPAAARDAGKPATQALDPNETILEVRGVGLRFGGLSAIEDLNMTLKGGQIVGLIGPNGAGKTSAFNVISGFYKPTAGEIRFLGKDITGLSPEEVCRAGMSRTFQNIRLFGTETVLQNVMVGEWVRQRSPWWATLLPFVFVNVLREEAEVRERAMALLSQLGLAAFAEEQASSLPYGAQRRLEIARALGTRPRFLLLDEPAAGMNPQESEELMRFIRRLRDDFHLTILLIEHDMKVVMNVCDVIHVLDQGQHIAWGAPAEIRTNPRVVAAYLGAEAGESGPETGKEGV